MVRKSGLPDLRGPSRTVAFLSWAVPDQPRTTRAYALALHRIRDTRHAARKMNAS
jgi:hypothetical protein